MHCISNQPASPRWCRPHRCGGGPCRDETSAEFVVLLIVVGGGGGRGPTSTRQSSIIRKWVGWLRDPTANLVTSGVHPMVAWFACRDCTKKVYSTEYFPTIMTLSKPNCSSETLRYHWKKRYDDCPLPNVRLDLIWVSDQKPEQQSYALKQQSLLKKREAAATEKSISAGVAVDRTIGSVAPDVWLCSYDHPHAPIVFSLEIIPLNISIPSKDVELSKYYFMAWY
jgi:hypothetical protein